MAEERVDTRERGRPSARGGARAASGGASCAVRGLWTPPSPGQPIQGAFLSALPTPSCDLTLPLETLRGILSVLTASAMWWQLTDLNLWLGSTSWAFCPITAPPSLPPRQPPSLPGTTIQLSHKQVKLNNLSGIPPASCVSVTHTNTAIRSVLRDRSPGVIYHPSLFLNDHLLSLCLCPA